MTDLPLFIHTLFRNFDGMLTRNFMPSDVSTSWRLFPRLPKIYVTKAENQYIMHLLKRSVFLVYWGGRGVDIK